MMSPREERRNRVKEFRLARGWTQQELAARAELSRTAVSAIEIERLVPSVAAALALARVFECRVEDLFGIARPPSPKAVWAWPGASDPCRFWQAEVEGRKLLYPVEGTGLGVVAHDGLWQHGRLVPQQYHPPEQTLVMASCDPAASLLATELTHATDCRLLVLPRSSTEALRLLGEGLVHLAGIHLAKAGSRGGNAAKVRSQLGTGYRLLHVARWEAGLAVGAGTGIRSVRAALQSKLRWVGREAGSGAQQCLDEISGGHVHPERVAGDHRGVADAVRRGWADLGVCLRLVSEEARLQFLSVRNEAYDICYRASFEREPRFQSLLRVIRSETYRRLLGELPGYDVSSLGEIEKVS